MGVSQTPPAVHRACTWLKKTLSVTFSHQLRIAWMNDGSHPTRSQMSCPRLETLTHELLYISGPTDMKRRAKVSKITWGIYDEHEREWEALCESRYWDMVEEGWFSD